VAWRRPIQCTSQKFLSLMTNPGFPFQKTPVSISKGQDVMGAHGGLSYLLPPTPQGWELLRKTTGSAMMATLRTARGLGSLLCRKGKSFSRAFVGRPVLLQRILPARLTWNCRAQETSEAPRAPPPLKAGCVEAPKSPSVG
jgi:hypothetical protein